MPETTNLHELRSSLRTHLFVGAVLKTPSGDCTARIRNISRTGALVEAAILPDSGTPVRLVRGSLSAEGKVVWRSGSRCGITFSSDVIVDAWLPDSNGRQAQVDALVRHIRNNEGASDPSFTGMPTNGEAREPKEVLAELASALGSHFSRDPLIVAKFPIELQGLDLLAQVLEAQNHPVSNRRLADAVNACSEMLVRLNQTLADPGEKNSIHNGPVTGSERNNSLTIPVDHVTARF